MNIGDKIPEVLGVDQDGREIKASDYRGKKIVLYSYPKANTSGCTAEACSLQAHKDELEQHRVIINVDMAAPVLAHRLILSPEARMRNMTAERVLSQVLGSVQVPVRTA